MTVRELWRYPVKSMQGEPVDALDLDGEGAAGDRRWCVRDRATGRVLSARRAQPLLHCSARTLRGGGAVVRLPEGGEHECGDPALDRALAGLLEREVETVAGRFADCPELVHLLSDQTLVELGPGGDARRYRANIIVGAPFAEDEWVGRRARLGSAELAVAEATVRCVLVTRSQAGGVAHQPRLLHDLWRDRQATVGVYLHAERAGTVRVGDAVEAVDG